MAKKLGIVLGSGGALGFAHIGFMQAMDENGIRPDVMTGCSMGAVVGACYLSGMTPEEMKQAAFRLKNADIIDFTISLFSNKALLKTNKMHSLIKRYVKKTTFEELPIPFATVAADLVTGKLITFTEGDLRLAVKASASIPCVFTPVEKDGMILVDGGILSRIPVAQARDLGAEKVVAVDVLGELPPYTEIKNIVNVALRAVDVSDHRPVYMWKPKDTPDLSVNPDFKNLSQYKVEEQKFIYEQGYLSGLAAVPEIKRMIEEEE